MQTGCGATSTVTTFKHIRQRRRRLFGAPTASKIKQISLQNNKTNFFFYLLCNTGNRRLFRLIKFRNTRTLRRAIIIVVPFHFSSCRERPTTQV